MQPEKRMERNDEAGVADDSNPAARRNLRPSRRPKVIPMKEEMDQSYNDFRKRVYRPSVTGRGSKSEPPKKRFKREIINENDQATGWKKQAANKGKSAPKGVAEEVKVEEADDMSATPSRTTGGRKQAADKGKSAPKELQVKLEEADDMSATQGRTTGGRKQAAGNGKNKVEQEEQIPGGFERHIPIERDLNPASDPACDSSKPAKINVTVLLVHSTAMGEQGREPWMPAAKKQFLESLGEIGRQHQILDISTATLYDNWTNYDLVDLYAFSGSQTRTPHPALTPALTIDNRVKELCGAYEISKVVLVGWGAAGLAVLSALPYAHNKKLACVVNIAFNETDFEKLDKDSIEMTSQYNVPILFVVGGAGGGADQDGKPAERAKQLRSSLTVPNGMIVVEKVNEELLVPVPMLRNSITEQATVNKRIAVQVSNFIRSTLKASRKSVIASRKRNES